MEKKFQRYFCKKNEERKIMWEDFFVRYANQSESEAIDISDLLNDFDEHNDNGNTHKKYKEIVENSNIRKLLLNLEVSRYQILKSEYEMNLHAFTEEIKILTKFVPDNWLEAYLESCMLLNSKIKNKINGLNTNIISLFIELTEVDSKRMFNMKYNLYKREFVRLLEFVSTEDLVLYIRDGFRGYFYETFSPS